MIPTLTQIVPTFKITGPDGKKLDTVKHCHLEVRFVLSTKIGAPDAIVDKQGFIYRPIWDSVHPTGKQTTEVLVSFQRHTYGNYAVIRTMHRSIK